MRVLLIQPGASYSTHDVFEGLDFGLQSFGLMVMPYRLDQRITLKNKWLKFVWREKKGKQKNLPKPQPMDVLYEASVDALNIALKHKVDLVIIVSAMFFHPDVITMLKRAGMRVAVLFTESPYDEEHELRIAGMQDDGRHVIDWCWTNERASVPQFQAVNPNAGYLPHAWHPEKHGPLAKASDLPCHDVVFVGSGFKERVGFFNSIDWTGIDLGLYGNWKDVGLNKQLRSCVKGGNITNDVAAKLYRNAKIGLNLYRNSPGWGSEQSSVVPESLSPRAYELAACGAFHLSEYRAEVPEHFGDAVPTFRNAAEASALIREWLPKETERTEVAAKLPSLVANDSWLHRTHRALSDLQRLLVAQVAA